MRALAIMASRPTFSKILYESVVNGMRNAIGESPMRAVLYHLKVSESAFDFQQFSKKLHFLFRDGATVLENVITKELYRNLNLQFVETSGFEFEAHVKRAEKAFLERVSEVKTD